jgi:hypothetical protein
MGPLAVVWIIRSSSVKWLAWRQKRFLRKAQIPRGQSCSGESAPGYLLGREMAGAPLRSKRRAWASCLLRPKAGLINTQAPNGSLRAYERTLHGGIASPNGVTPIVPILPHDWSALGALRILPKHAVGFGGRLGGKGGAWQRVCAFLNQPPATVPL